MDDSFKHPNCLVPRQLEIDRPRHLLEVQEAGVDLEGLSDRDAGLLAERVVRQAAERREMGIDESHQDSKDLVGTR